MSQTLSFNQVSDWLSWLEQQHPSHEIDMGLERIRQVSKRLLKNTPIAKQVITVAGTNGKGSTVAFFERYFRSSWFILCQPDLSSLYAL